MGERWINSGRLRRQPIGTDDFESVILAIHVVSAEGLIVEINRAFELMFGASRCLYLGKHQAVLGVDPLAAGLRLLDRIRREVKPRGVWKGTMRNERFNGTPFTTRAHAYPMSVGGRAYLVFFQEEIPAATWDRTPVTSSVRRQVLGASS